MSLLRGWLPNDSIYVIDPNYNGSKVEIVKIKEIKENLIIL